jgi:hypothetical protein
MFDWPARMKTLSGLASAQRVARSADVRKVMMVFMGLEEVSGQQSLVSGRRREGAVVFFTSMFDV